MIDPSLAAAIAAKTALLLLVSALLTAGLTKQSSALRHALWIGTLLLALLMPVAVLTLPALEVIPGLRPLTQVAVASSDAPAHATANVDLWYFGFMLWIAGAIVLLLRMLASQAALVRWQARAQPLQSQAWTRTLQRGSSEMPIPRSLRVLESSAITNPCTWGFIRPVLLLPARGEFTEAQRRFALLHELAHIRRHDWLTSTLGELACAIHWYNPLVWVAARESRRLQEQACDDAVLQSGVLASDYAMFLRRAAAHEQDAPRLVAAMGIVGRTDLRKRVNSILDPEQRRAPLTNLRVLGLSFTAACVALFLGAAAPQSPAQSADPPNVKNEVVAEVAEEAAEEISAEVAEDVEVEVSAEVVVEMDDEQSEKQEEAVPPRPEIPAPPTPPVPPPSLPALPPIAALPPIGPLPAMPATPAVAATPATPATLATPAAAR
jgi:bla regulator protein blaR1